MLKRNVLISRLWSTVCSAWHVRVINGRDSFQSSRLTGVRLRAVITLQTVWWEIGHELNTVTCRVCSSRRCVSDVVRPAQDVVSPVCRAVTTLLSLCLPAPLQLALGRSSWSRFPVPALDLCSCSWTHVAAGTRARGWCTSCSGCLTLDKCLISPTTGHSLGASTCFLSSLSSASS